MLRYVHSSTVPRQGKISKCLLTSELIKVLHIYTHNKYYSVIKKNEIMSFAAIWLNLEIIIVSDTIYTIYHLDVESKL